MTLYSYVLFKSFVKPTTIASALFAITTTTASLLCMPICKAESDLDDNVATFKGDPISKWDNLEKKSVNINFIIVEALGGIKLPNKDKIVNSVVVGPGSSTGDIYNIHINSGGTTTSTNKTKENETKDNKSKKQVKM